MANARARKQTERAKKVQAAQAKRHAQIDVDGPNYRLSALVGVFRPFKKPEPRFEKFDLSAPSDLAAGLAKLAEPRGVGGKAIIECTSAQQAEVEKMISDMNLKGRVELRVRNL